jgi:hypothetical protein
MPYVTTIEHLAIQRGRAEGREEGLRGGLIEGIALAQRIKFGPADQAIVPGIGSMPDLETIRAVATRIETAQALDDIREAYA